METLRSRVTLALVAGFLALVGIDVVDDLFLGDRWGGCPREMYPLIGGIVAGLFAAEALRKRNGNSNGKPKED